MDKLTKRWVRNSSDEAAIAAGARFNLMAGSYYIWWVERYCKLYEGEQANQPMVMHSAVDQPNWEIPKLFNWKDKACRNLFTERCEWHLDAFDSGCHMDWPYECHMRIYGWQMRSEHFKRMVRRFTQSIIFVAKKNKKSPVLAANALYLTCGDAEEGAKSFLMAKTGKQAREIAGKHIQHMYLKSEDLHRYAKFNKNEMTLTFHPTNSILQPLSSDTKDAREGNEGRNGNVLIDELHVVDRETVDIVDRAGISRAEPLHMEFSTAGKDNNGYGRERFDQGLAIQKSEEINIRTFSAIYAAPQDLEPVNITDDNVLEIAKAANPALGHTIDPAELRQDRVNSLRTPHKTREFMMYRFNIWRSEGIQTVSYLDWERCGADFKFEDFSGEDCVCALDMALNDDLVAFAFNFLRDGKVWVWVDHWLPKVTAIERQDKIPLLDWERDDWIRLLPGKLIDEDSVFNDIMARAQDVNIKSIAYDPNRARYLRTRLETEGFPMELFRQNNREFHPCVERWEKLVHGDERTKTILLHHPNNPLLNFQVRHHNVDEDRFSYKRIVKPESGDHKKVDGLQAVVMTMRAMDTVPEEIESAYTDPNALWLRPF